MNEDENKGAEGGDEPIDEMFLVNQIKS